MGSGNERDRPKEKDQRAHPRRERGLRLCVVCRRAREEGEDHPRCSPTCPCPWAATPATVYRSRWAPKSSAAFRAAARRQAASLAVFDGRVTRPRPTSPSECANHHQVEERRHRPAAWGLAHPWTHSVFRKGLVRQRRPRRGPDLVRGRCQRAKSHLYRRHPGWTCRDHSHPGGASKTRKGTWEVKVRLWGGDRLAHRATGRTGGHCRLRDRPPGIGDSKTSCRSELHLRRGGPSGSGRRATLEIPKVGTPKAGLGRGRDQSTRSRPTRATFRRRLGVSIHPSSRLRSTRGGDTIKTGTPARSGAPAGSSRGGPRGQFGALRARSSSTTPRTSAGVHRISRSAAVQPLNSTDRPATTAGGRPSSLPLRLSA